MKILDPRYPVNTQHPLNAKRLAWYLGIANPGWSGALVSHDLMRGTRNPQDSSTWVGTTGLPTWFGSRGRLGGQRSISGNVNGGGNAQNIPLPASLVTAMNGIPNASVAWWSKAFSTGINGVPVGLENSASPGPDYPFSNGDIYLSTLTGARQCTALVSPAGFVFTNWNRALITFNGSITTWTLYLNGVQAVQATSGTGSVTSVNLGFIFKSTAGGTSIYAGIIDDVSMWTRTLTPLEAMADFQLSKQGYPGLLNYAAVSGPRSFSLASTPVNRGMLLGVG